MTALNLGTTAAGDSIELPIDAVTSAFAVLGQRGTGKTNGAVVMVEEMVRAGGHVAVLDPVGAWWGCTHDGDGPGLEGIVIGGEHGDVPLEETGGHLVAELVTSRQWPLVVIDMKLLRKGAQLRFMADYCETLFHDNREALHQVFEEADRAAPQQARSQDVSAMRLLGAVEDIVKLGRSRGLGATLVTQRPATLNKNVLEVCENLLLFRLMGPNDQKAARGWVEANGDPAALKRVMGSLASLGTGECWLYSPAWLGLLEQIKVRKRQTFDSSFTPKVGQLSVEPTKRTPVDLDALRAAMAETVARHEAQDPKKLRAEVERLKAELAKGVKPAENIPPTFLPCDHELIIAQLQAENGQLYEENVRLRNARATVESNAQGWAFKATEITDSVRRVLAMSAEILAGGDGRLQPAKAPTSVAAPTTEAHRPVSQVPEKLASHDSASLAGLKAGARRLLEELASRYPARWTRPQLGTLTGFAHKGGTFTTYLGELKRRGLVAENAGEICATDAGLDALGGKPPAPTSHADAMAMWSGSLKAGCFRMLQAVVAAGPDGISRAGLAAAVEMAASGGTFSTYLGILRRNGLVVEDSGAVVATDVLFPEASR